MSETSQAPGRRRVACFCANYPPLVDSEALVSAKWVRAMREIGWEVVVLTSEPHRWLEAGHRMTQIRDVFEAARLRALDVTRLPYGPVSFVPESVRRFLQLHRESPFDAIISRYEPSASAIAAYWAAKKTGVPWVASFNDPLPRITQPRPGLWGAWDGLRNSFQERWTRPLLEAPQALVFPCRRLADWIIERGVQGEGDQARLRERLTIIPHIGGPLEPIEPRPSLQEEDGRRRVLRHIGYLSRRRDPTTLLGAMRLWDQDVSTPTLDVELIGDSSGQSAALSAYQRSGPSKARLRILPAVSPGEAFELMRTATACILIEEPGPRSIFLPSKFCDYAAAGAWVVAITPNESEVGDAIRCYGGGVVVDHGNPAGLFAAMKSLLRTVPSNEALRDAYSARQVAAQWQRVLVNLVWRSHR